MNFLSKLGKFKILRDETRFLQSENAATVTVSWKAGNVGGTFNPLFKQFDGGTEDRTVLAGLKAEKIVVTPTTISELDFGIIKVGDVIFRFHHTLDLNKPELKITHNSVDYFPITFSPQQQEVLAVAIGDDQVFQTLVCSRTKPRSSERT